MDDMDDLLLVDGVLIKTPSIFEWGKSDVSGKDATRNQVAYMYKNRIAKKRKISLAWWMTNKPETTAILQAFDPEYFMVTYYDPLLGTDATKEFYCGDMSAPVKTWTKDNKRYTSVSFDIIER